MKEKELRQHAKCSICSNSIGATGLPLFWTVIITRHGIKLDAVQRQDFLAGFLGNSELARVMGTDEHLTEIMLGPVELTLCEKCALESDVDFITIAFQKAENGGG